MFLILHRTPFAAPCANRLRLSLLLTVSHVTVVHGYTLLIYHRMIFAAFRAITLRINQSLVVMCWPQYSLYETICRCTAGNKLTAPRRNLSFYTAFASLRNRNVVLDSSAYLHALAHSSLFYIITITAFVINVVCALIGSILLHGSAKRFTTLRYKFTSCVVCTGFTYLLQHL